MKSSTRRVDFRSDTVTQPCEGMRAAMAEAPVGDDVYGDDPTVIQLQQTLAQRLGKSAALFLPSGTQSNLTAVMAHCERGQEYIIGNQYHVYKYEALGSSVLGSVAPCPISTATDGTVAADDVRAAIKPDDPHFPVSRLLCLENTVTGRAIAPPALLEPIRVARDAGLRCHLDGARLFNASTALGVDPAALAEPFDSVSVCLSKGLGAPVGSVLVGDGALISRAHRIRKMLGGGMRQAGVLAAAGLYALSHNVDRLADDHQNAIDLAQALSARENLWDQPVQVHTNMVFISPRAAIRNALIQFWQDRKVLTGRPAATMRLVIHKDIDQSQLDYAITTLTQFNA